MNERSSWIDNAKGIGIALVVYGHVARGLIAADSEADHTVLKAIDAVIYSFHMPLFFFLSGLLFYRSLDRQGRTSLLASKMRTILYPYVLWSLIQGSVEVLLSAYTNGGASFLEVLSFPWSPRAQFWYLYVLFILFAGGALIYPRGRTAGRRNFCLGGFFVLAALFVLKDSVYWGRVATLIASSAVFFALGILSSEQIHRHATVVRNLLPVVAIAFVFVQTSVVFGFVDLTVGWIALPVALISITFICSLAMKVEGRLGWLMSLGSASMAIYLMHILAGSGVRIVLAKTFGIESIPVHLVFGTAAGILLPMAADILIRRFGLSLLYVAPAFRRRAARSAAAQATN